MWESRHNIEICLDFWGSNEWRLFHTEWTVLSLAYVPHCRFWVPQSSITYNFSNKMKRELQICLKINSTLTSQLQEQTMIKEHLSSIRNQRKWCLREDWIWESGIQTQKTLLQKIASSELTENDENAKSLNKMPTEITAKDDESYAKSSTGITDCTTYDDRIVKILGVKWNTFSAQKG